MESFIRQNKTFPDSPNLQTVPYNSSVWLRLLLLIILTHLAIAGPTDSASNVHSVLINDYIYYPHHGGYVYVRISLFVC